MLTQLTTHELSEVERLIKNHVWMYYGAMKEVCAGTVQLPKGFSSIAYEVDYVISTLLDRTNREN